MFIGLLVGGYAGDRWGRKITYDLPIVGVILATWVMVYPKHFAVYIAARTFIGMTSGKVFLVSCIYVYVVRTRVQKVNPKMAESDVQSQSLFNV